MGVGILAREASGVHKPTCVSGSAFLDPRALGFAVASFAPLASISHLRWQHNPELSLQAVASFSVRLETSPASNALPKVGRPGSRLGTADSTDSRNWNLANSVFSMPSQHVVHLFLGC